MTTINGSAEWWRQAVVYQVYPRSFYDANGDGLGDIKGVTTHMGYLHDLGVDAIWLSPFYPSPLADGGYDVADYRNVDPRLGTLEDFDEMVDAVAEEIDFYLPKIFWKVKRRKKTSGGKTVVDPEWASFEKWHFVYPETRARLAAEAHASAERIERAVKAKAWRQQAADEERNDG